MNGIYPTTAASRHPWLAVMAAGLATFVVVTTEMLPVGLLTPIAEALAISTGMAGWMISLPALLAALFAPTVLMAAGNIDRRRLLAVLLLLLALANLFSALAPDIGWMLAARVLVGLCMGGIWAIAGGLAARLVSPHAVGLATSVIFGGVAAASVLGVPLGAVIGDIAGWRWAFAGMSLLSLAVLALHLAVMPRLPVAASATPRLFCQQMRNGRLRIGLLMTLLLVAGHFMAFTFVRPLLSSVSGFSAHWIGALLLAYGLAGVIGNFLAGLSAMHRPLLTLGVISLGLLLAPLLLLGAGASHLEAGMALMFWGLIYGGVSVSLMTWIMKAAPQAIEVATSIYVATFNIGIALGSWAGGQIVDSLGLEIDLRFAASLAGSALLLSAYAGWSPTPGNTTRP